MNAKRIALGAALTAVLSLGSAAQAATYSFSYTANDASITASGLLTTSDVLNGLGGYDITAISGTVGGNAIAGLLGGAGAVATSPAGAFIYDNTVYPAPALSTNGVLFTAVADGREWNLWGTGGTGASLYAGVGAGNYSVRTNGTLTISAVPEPETYALMLAGLGAVGFVARRRKIGA